MAISYIGGRTQGFLGTTSNVTVNLTGLTGGFDTAPSAGDFVVVFYGVGSNVITRNITIGSGQGWTGLTKINANFVYDTNYVVAYKRMGSTPDTSVTVSGTGNTADAGAVVVHVFRGVDEATPLDVAAVTARGANTSLANPPAITPVTSGAIIIASAATAYAEVFGRQFFSSELFNFLSVGSNDTYDVSVGAGWIDWTSGAFDPAAFGWSGTDSTNNSWAAYTLALRPSPEPDPPSQDGPISFVGSTVRATFQGTVSDKISLAGLGGGSDPYAREGDLVVVFIGSTSVANEELLSIDTAGYTLFTQVYSEGSVVAATLLGGYKFMGSTPDSSIEFSGWDSANARAGANVSVYRGVDPTNPMDVAAVLSEAVDSWLPDAAAITPVTPGAWVVVGAQGARDTFSFSLNSPANMTGQGAAFTNQSTPTVVASYTSSARAENVSGTFNPDAFTSTNGPVAGQAWAAYTLALRPAPIPGVAVDPDDITTASPVIGSSTVAQVHSLTPAAIVTGAALLGAAALSQGHVLAGQGIVTGAPNVGQAALTQAHALAPNGLTTGAPVLGSPTIAVEGVVSPANLETGSPVLGPPVLAQTHSFVVVDLALDNPVLGSFVVSEEATVLKYWDGAIWANGLVKRFDGVDWVNTKLKRFNGSSWT